MNREIEIWSKMYTDNKWRLEKTVKTDGSNYTIKNNKVGYMLSSTPNTEKINELNMDFKSKTCNMCYKIGEVNNEDLSGV